jgi:hypothetical protein
MATKTWFNSGARRSDDAYAREMTTKSQKNYFENNPGSTLMDWQKLSPQEKVTQTLMQRRRKLKVSNSPSPAGKNYNPQK